MVGHQIIQDGQLVKSVRTRSNSHQIIWHQTICHILVWCQIIWRKIWSCMARF